VAEFEAMRAAQVHQLRHPSAADRRVAVPPQVVDEADRVLRCHHCWKRARDDVNAALEWLAEQPSTEQIDR
jgi:hypothetical protein